VLSQVRMINLMDNMWMGCDQQPLEGFSDASFRDGASKK
jgi:hypothetical protein